MTGSKSAAALFTEVSLQLLTEVAADRDLLRTELADQRHATTARQIALDAAREHLIRLKEENAKLRSDLQIASERVYQQSRPINFDQPGAQYYGRQYGGQYGQQQFTGQRPCGHANVKQISAGQHGLARWCTDCGNEVFTFLRDM